jgi:putative membrane protein
MTFADLPAVNACFNALSTALLTVGYVLIRRKHQAAHRACMLGALASSVLFLCGYLTYHFTVRTVTRFHDPRWFRPVYLAILLTHTVLAVVIVPLVLITVTHALRERFDAHRRIARWTWPLWMYVSATGVLIFLLLYRIFPQH